VFVFIRVCLCGGVRFGIAMYQCRFFLYDIAVLLLLFQKKGAFILPSGQKGRVRRRD
jgi:hypothetical protein